MIVIYVMNARDYIPHDQRRFSRLFSDITQGTCKCTGCSTWPPEMPSWDHGFHSDRAARWHVRSNSRSPHWVAELPRNSIRKSPSFRRKPLQHNKRQGVAAPKNNQKMMGLLGSTLVSCPGRPWTSTGGFRSSALSEDLGWCGIGSHG